MAWIWEADGNHREAKAILSYHLEPSLPEELSLSPKIDLDKNSQILCFSGKKEKDRKKKIKLSPGTVLNRNRKMQVNAVA